MSILTLVVVVFIVFYLLSSIKILAEYERGVIFRLGRLLPEAKGPGLILVFTPVDRMVRISLRQEAFEVPPQDIITRDNVTLKVNAVIFLRVVEPRNAVVQVTNYIYQTSQFAQTTLRSVLGEVELDELLSQRDKLNIRIQEILDAHTEPWGVKVVNVEVKQVDLPESMLRAMAKRIQAAGVKPEIEVFDTGHLVLAKQLVKEGLIDDPVMIQLCMGIPYGAPNDPSTLTAMVNNIPQGWIFSAFSIGRMQLPYVAMAALTDRKSTRLNSSHYGLSRMPSSA